MARSDHAYRQTALAQLGETGQHETGHCPLCVIPVRKVAEGKTRTPVYGVIAEFVQRRNCVTMNEAVSALLGKVWNLNGKMASRGYIRWGLEDLSIAGYLGRHKVGNHVFFFSAFNGDAFETLGIVPRKDDERYQAALAQKRTTIPKWLRDKKIDATDGCCPLCIREGFWRIDFEIDHILAWSKGGPDDEENLQALCRTCNHVKSTLSMAEARLRLQVLEPDKGLPAWEEGAVIL